MALRVPKKEDISRVPKNSPDLECTQQKVLVLAAAKMQLDT